MHNVFLVLLFLYLFGVVDHELVFDVLDLLVARFFEVRSRSLHVEMVCRVYLYPL